MRTAGLVGGMKSSVWPKSGGQGEIQGDEVGKVRWSQTTKGC